MESLIFKLKQLLKKTFIFNLIVYKRRLVTGYDELTRLASQEKHVYSPTHDLIKSIQEISRIQYFVETGTLIGDTLIALQGSFDKLVSIELDQGIFNLAKKRLSKYSNVNIFLGDSAILLPRILNELSEPALFWLDAHYSSGVTALGESQTPVIEELKAIFSHPIKKHYILIDDVKDFTGLNDYPTVQQMLQFIELFGGGNYRGRVEQQVFIVEPVAQ
jgi:hypothetical protein